MRTLILVGCAVLATGSGWAQKTAVEPSVADVTLSVVGDPTGLDEYVAVMTRAFKEAWIDRWPHGGAESGRFVLRFRVNRAGYLGLVESNCSKLGGKGFCEPDARPPMPPTPLIPMSHSELMIERYQVPNSPIAQMERSAADAFHSVFVGLPPGPPEDYPRNTIKIKATFKYGTEKPRI